MPWAVSERDPWATSRATSDKLSCWCYGSASAEYQARMAVAFDSAHISLRTCVGSRRDARRAGRKPAMKAMAESTAAARTSVNGSPARTP